MNNGQTEPGWPSIGIAADLLASWLIERPAPYGCGVYDADALAAVRWALEHEPALFARLVLRNLPADLRDPGPLPSKQSVAGKGTST